MIALWNNLEITLKNYDMKVFYESKLAKMLLFEGYNTITLGCFVLTKKTKEEMKPNVLNHEAIHVRQWEECLIASAILLTLLMVFTHFVLWVYILSLLWFYLQYGIEYLISRIYHAWRGLSGKDGNEISYDNSAFEMEANANENIEGYLDVRVPFEFVRYYGRI